jgi:glyoxylase-like metal-dependent hydrolase (beta-lactamase superfamily II)
MPIFAIALSLACAGSERVSRDRTGAVQVTRLADGLWRWTALHPDWKPGDGGPDGWEQEVSCVYLEAPDHVVLVDPLVPGDERGRFYEALDRDVERAGRPVAIAITCESHGRSAAELRERYDAEVWAPAGAVGVTQAPVTRPFAPGDRLPGGLDALDVGFPAEVLLWIPAHATLVAGDAILGTLDGLRRCPDSWLPRALAPARFVELLSRVLRLPVERVVPTHGDPVEQDAQAALRAAIER